MNETERLSELIALVVAELAEVKALSELHLLCLVSLTAKIANIDEEKLQADLQKDADARAKRYREEILQRLELLRRKTNDPRGN